MSKKSFISANNFPTGFDVNDMKDRCFLCGRGLIMNEERFRESGNCCDLCDRACGYNVGLVKFQSSKKHSAKYLEKKFLKFMASNGYRLVGKVSTGRVLEIN